MEGGQRPVTSSADLVMKSFNVLIESRDELKTVRVFDCEGIGHAREVLRKKYSFDEWRIVNIAERSGIPADER